MRTRSRRASRASGFSLNPPSGTDPMAMYGFEEHFEETSLRNALITYLQYALLALLGHVHEILRSLGIERSRSSAEPPQTRVCSCTRTFILFLLFPIIDLFQLLFNNVLINTSAIWVPSFKIALKIANTCLLVQCSKYKSIVASWSWCCILISPELIFVIFSVNGGVVVPQLHTSIITK